MDLEAWSEEEEKLENDFGIYTEIEQPQSSDNFRILENFTEQLKGNGSLRNKLLRALNNKHPFRNFKLIIDNS